MDRGSSSRFLRTNPIGTSSGRSSASPRRPGSIAGDKGQCRQEPYCEHWFLHTFRATYATMQAATSLRSVRRTAVPRLTQPPPECSRAAGRLRDADQRVQNVSHVSGPSPKREVQAAEQAIEFVINALLGAVGLEHAVRRANLVLRFFDRLESARGEERKDRRTQAGHAFRRNQYRPAEHVGVHAIQNFVLLRYPTGIDYALNMDSVAFHAVEDYARMEGGALNRREQFVLRGALEVPSQGDTTKIGIHQNRAIAVVPGHAQQTGLSGVIVLQPLAERRDIRTRASSDGIEDVADRGKPGFNASSLRMHASLHYAANAGH